MAKDTIVHLVRHAQGYHQIPEDHPNADLPDPYLTPHGIEQCKNLCKRFPAHADVKLLCASPMRRAIQTAMIAFEPAAKRGLKVVALPDAQEGSDVPSDTGSPPEELKKEFGDAVDYTHVTRNWYEKTGPNETDREALEARARRLRQWLRKREEKEIVLVTHGYFAHFLTGNIDENGEQTGEYWVNVREKSFTFQDDNHEQAVLVETEDSRRKTAERENTEDS